MALVVETGAGLPNAEAYISVADADAYFAARGNATWAALDTTKKEQSLRKGADYMLAEYAGRWAGQRTTDTQALDWPRVNVPRRDVAGGYGQYPVYWPDDVVPEPVRRANAELAVRASTGDLEPDVGAQVKQEVVGPISVTYQDGARQNTAFKAVDGMLAPFLSGGGGSGQVPVIRA